ncbi:DUF2059 domain-containing protein [Pseudotabrizicola algicola]|uniref:DUF2059 domain-containing protein n=1 Tax=Pseudotabrizicola algicola TaxID=2709381 RepID=A0A6B3RQG6_9RHOB|nr:DUF2059 domain-containing protein [Pseudotabrizicola algicola]NEX48337.1 DUF2059 domain-containing protein [Pseudotabrizicola algicola]
MSLPKAVSAFGLSLALGFGLAVIPAGSFSARAETVAGQVAPAVDAARVAALAQTLKMDAIFAVMREEGLEYGQTLADEMFPGNGGAQWQATVSKIYDAETMRSRFSAALTEALATSEPELAAMEGFFGSAQGQAILQLEIEARRAMLDDDIEDAAKLAWQDMQASGGDRVDRLMRFASVNDLVESNVMGAMNANLAFYRGLSESGAFPQAMTEDQMLADVWAQEPDVRTETTDWLFPFLMLAYQPLSEQDLDAYIGFSETPAGQKLNAALFSAYDAVFSQISYDLGRAAAAQMMGEDI